MRAAHLGALVSAAALACGACSSSSVNGSGTGASDAGASPITLTVDDLGVTHVVASSDADALYGAGYAMARDRLFQMEVTRRQTEGTLAAMLGDTAVKGDIAARAIHFSALGQADLARLVQTSPADAALFDAWTRGVNARIAEVRAGTAPRPYGLGPAELDFVPTDWETWETFAIAKRLAFGLSSTLDYEILATAIHRLAPQFASGYPLLLPAYDIFTTKGAEQPHTTAPAPPSTSIRPPAGAGALVVPPGVFSPAAQSNNWGADGAHSANGRPWIAGDPHQSLTSPSRFWPVHIKSTGGGGTLDAIGFSFVGTPLVELGHTAGVGWTATNGFADVLDLWDVTIDPSGTSVTLGGSSHAVTQREETIRVRAAGKPVGEGSDTTATILEVPGFGVILPDALLPLPKPFLIDGNAILMQWTGFAPTLDSASYLAMDRAGTVDEFERAVDLLEVGAQNFIAADARELTYRVHADVPDRGAPSARPMPWRIRKADDPGALWTGAMLGGDKLPHLRAPARGLLSSANNDPFGYTADGVVENDPWYYGAFFATAFRAHRIDEALTELTARKKVERADFEAMQADVDSALAATVLPKLAAAMAARKTDPALSAWASRDDLAPLATALASWNGHMDADRGEPVALLGLGWFAAKRAFEAKLTSQLFEAIGSKSAPYLLCALRNVLERRFQGAETFLPAGGDSALLLAALDDTHAWLGSRFGSADTSTFKLADYQAAAFSVVYGLKLDVGRFPMGGGADTIDVAEVPFFSGGKPLQQATIPERGLYRMVVGFGDDGTPEATVDFALGASEDPTSPHFLDRQPDWVATRLVPLPFRDEDVAAHATDTLTLR